MVLFKHIRRPYLLPLSFFYGLVVLVRNVLFDIRILRSTHFKLPVISIGNITVGGTGKTPHVEYLVHLLKHDLKLAVLSRGYKRKTSHFILASRKAGVKEIGDEPRQIKLKFPDIHVAVERNRVKGVKILMKSIHKLELVILDDAYQHRYIRPGLSILLVDYNRPVFNDILLPAGNLREFRSSIRRADVIIITKCPDNLSVCDRSVFIARLHPASKQEVFFTKYNYGSPLPVFPDKRDKEGALSFNKLQESATGIMLVTGIANPKPLKQFLMQITPVVEELTFPDHHDFNRQDYQQITSIFGAIEAEEKYIIVTEKDAMRIREADLPDKTLKKAFYYIPVEVKFLAHGEKPFTKRVYKYLKKSGIAL